MEKQWHLISGAGSGIGKAIAQTLASDINNRLILLGRNQEKIEKVQSELPRPEDHLVVVADISNKASLNAAFKAMGLGKQPLRSIIANAGIGGENVYGDRDRWDEIIDTNLGGTYRLINEALPSLRLSTEGARHIVMISSILARIGVPRYSAYSASKAGLLGLTRSLAVELASENILVNAICPGWVDTEMSTDGLKMMAANTAKTFAEVSEL